MALLLKGKVCAITGGATGIGRAIALGYLQQGAQVVVNHLGDPASQNHVAELRREADSPTDDIFRDFAGDISQPDTARAFVDFVVTAFGRLDVMVANAGIARFHEFLSTPDDWIQDHIHVNIGGTYYVTREAGRAMKAAGNGGSIIGMSSISAHTGSTELVHYTPTKAAVYNLMQSTAVALGPYGIRANSLGPGTIVTALNQQEMSNETKRKAATDRTALKRLGEPKDLAGPAIFLASDLSLYVTGAHIPVDGGAIINY